MTKHIEKNTATQVNSERIGVQVNPDVASVKADMTVTKVQVSSTVDIEGTDYQLIRTSKRRVYYCSGETVTVTIDESDVTYVQFVLFASNQRSGDVDIVWAEGSSMSDVALNAYFYTLDYDPDTETYSNPQRLNSNEKVAYIFNVNGYCYITGKCSVQFSPDDPPTVMDNVSNILSAPSSLNGLGSLYDIVEGKTFLCRIGGPDYNLNTFGYVVDTEEIELTGIEFYPKEPVEQPETQFEPAHYCFDVDKYIPVEGEVSDYGWTIVGFMPKDNTKIGDVMDTDSPYMEPQAAPGTEWSWVQSDWVTATITDIDYSENNCQVSYSVRGDNFTDVGDPLTDENNVICNIPRYVYLKFSQDVDITEE